MSAATWRYDFYLDANGNLMKTTSRRPTGRGPWPQPRPHSLWVVSIERHDNGLRATRGPQWTPSREAEAIARTVFPDSTTNDLGLQVPDAVREAFRERLDAALQAAADKIARRWHQLHTENAMVGVLVGELDGIVVTEGGWTVSVEVQTFSDKTKEPVIGADLGWIVEIRDGAQETVKALLMQAKKTEALNGWQDLPDLYSQMEDMSKVTNDHYGLILTPHGIVLTTSDGGAMPLVDGILESVKCERGDQSPAAVANAIDARHVVLLDLQSPRSPMDDPP